MKGAKAKGLEEVMTNNALNNNHHHHKQTIMRIRLNVYYNVLKVVVNIILCDEAGAGD